MKKWLVALLIITLLVPFPLASCKGLVKGSEELKSRDFTRSDFSEVKVDDGIELHIVYDTSFNVTITADDNLFDYLNVSLKGETLSFNLKNNEYVDATVKAYITMPHLRKLNLNGASICSISDFDTRAGVEFHISGDSVLNSDNMTVGDIILDVYDASKATGNITAGDVRLKADSGSTVQLDGAANDLVCEVGGSSLLKLEGFSLRNVEIKMSGESVAGINVSGKLDVDLKKNSKLTYYGDPVLGSTRIDGGSTMERK